MLGEDPNRIGIRLHAAGWRTGSVLSVAHVSAISYLLQRAGEKPREVNPADWLIVVSQTCDIVVPELRKEPYVEVLLAEPRAKIDSTIANLKSTRRLSFRSQGGGQVLEAHGTDRFWLPRIELDAWGPDAIRLLGANAADRISRWLAMRYTRAPWPFSLVKRLGGKEAHLKDILRAVDKTMAEVRVSISDDDKELPEAIPYRLKIYAVVDANTYDGRPDLRAECELALIEFLHALRSCAGIEVDESSQVISGAEFSWEETRQTHEWNFANLTDATEGD